MVATWLTELLLDRINRALLRVSCEICLGNVWGQVWWRRLHQAERATTELLLDRVSRALLGLSSAALPS